MKMKIINYIVICALWAGNLEFAWAADNATNYLDKGLGARPISIGGAYTAIAEGVDAIFYNPAGLALEKRSSFAASSSRYFEEINNYSTSLVVPLPSLDVTFGLTFNHSSIDGVPKSYADSNQRPVIESYFSEIKNAYVISFAKCLRKDFSIGLNIKSLTHSLYSAQATGLGLDLGFFYTTSNVPLRFGLNIRNLTKTQMNWSTGNIDTIPRELNLGTAYYGRVLENNFIIAMNADLKENQILRLSLGGEYNLFADFFSIRGGVNPEEIAGGLGFNLKRFSFDYAYLQHQELGITNRASISWNW
jgi:hypothetical protein